MAVTHSLASSRNKWWSRSDQTLRLIERIRREANKAESLSTAQLTESVQSLRAEFMQAGQGTSTGWGRWWGSGGSESSRELRAFALATEAVRRALGKRLYDVQLMGGIHLSRGRIAEMNTGEGKTVTTVVPAFLHSLYGKGVHVATTNAYLAERDCEELRAVFELVGISVGVLKESASPTEKEKAYRCDITFGPGYEFGFDYLRDQIALRSRQHRPLGQRHIRTMLGLQDAAWTPTQRGHSFAIVDEADSVLIDEATMPMILSTGQGKPPSPELYELARETALSLQPDEDYELDLKQKKIEFTTQGWTHLHQVLAGIDLLPLDRPWSRYVENALRAEFILQRDEDYVVRDGGVQIVDQHTGRIHDERTWRDGLHQAIERKEGVENTSESASDARMTRQRYFQLYDGLCGMTGTADGLERELQAFYGLSIVPIPTNKPNIRESWPLRTFRESEKRNQAIIADAARLHRTGRPVLIGTRTIRHSVRLSEMLRESGVPHTVLNGVQDEDEAKIVGRAGVAGTVTVATNMAGRGTDIRLDPVSLAAGGLHVIAAEHNLSPRVDRQLSGRAARQGNPGSSQFFISMEDELVQSDEELITWIQKSADNNGECLGDASEAVQRIQQKMEAKAYEQRQRMVARDAWMDGVLKTLASS